jgi:hypothetical protein
MNDLKMVIWPLVLSSRGADCVLIVFLYAIISCFLLEICMSTRNQLVSKFVFLYAKSACSKIHQC